MKLLYSLIFLLVFINPSLSQSVREAIRLKGKVLAYENCQPLAGCKLWIEGTNYGAITDANGIFIFNYPIHNTKDTITLTIHQFGFEEQKVKLEAKKSGEYQLNIGLYPKVIILNNIIIGKKAKIKSSELKKQKKETLLKGKILETQSCQFAENLKLFFKYQGDSLKKAIPVNGLGEFYFPIYFDNTQFIIGEIILESANFSAQKTQIHQLNVSDIIIWVNDLSFKENNFSSFEDDDDFKYMLLVDENAEFMGGIHRFYTITQKNITTLLKKKKIQNTIFITFDINKGGELTNKKIISKIDTGIEHLILNSLPTETWKQAKYLGRPKISHFVLPITFF